jgi:ElaB/YqjD/DUF883 family membrane-anchored ribosome-binding protein
MAQRNPELPEGTDHIINGAMETNTGTGASTGSSGGAGGLSGGATGTGMTGTGGGDATGSGGGSASGFIGGGDTSVLGDDTGGLAGGTGGTGGGGFGGSGGGSSGGGDNFGSGGSSGGQGGTAVNQLKSGAQNLRQQATGKVREYAEDGKGRATSALGDFSNVIREAADSIDERLGSEYGQYARRAADAVQDFSRNIEDKSVDELYDDARDIVRKSPAVAIGVAAAVGFALVRLVKAGVPDEQRDVEFEPDPNFGTGSSGSATASGTPPTVNPASGA